MSLISQIHNSWGWAGINPTEVVGENDFGSLLVKDEDGRYWRICPDEVFCEVIAEDKEQLDKLSKDKDFLEDWFMSALVDRAIETVGPLESGKKYCLAIPKVLGGAYEASNLKSATFLELIRAAGDFGRQIRELSDSTQKGLAVVDF